MIHLPWPMTRGLVRELKYVVLYSDSLLDSWSSPVQQVFKGFPHTIGLVTYRCNKLAEDERFFKLSDSEWLLPRCKKTIDRAVSLSVSLGYPIVAIPCLTDSLPEAIANEVDSIIAALAEKVKWEHGT